MQNSHSNNDACFRVDVIDEVTKEELDALVNDSEPFLKEEFEDNFEELPLEEKLRIKTSVQDLPTDLEMKPLPDHLECTFLEKDSLLPVVISAPLKDNEKKRLVADSFYSCLANLEQMLIRCKQSHLVLNWEKCHFMVTEGIVLGHKVSSEGLEVDKEKIDVIAKLPPLTNAFEALKEKLMNAPIMVSPDWSQPFELICDASDFAVGAVLGKHEGKHFLPIHFANKTLNKAQQNYTVTEKELLVVQDAKPHLIRWILLLQEFDIEIKNKKGAENVTTDHLSRLENPNMKEFKGDDINDNSHDETLMNVSSNDEDVPWFANFANYLVGKILRKGMTYAQR
ncbi:reverse transcriptase domain-containing protein [Tanacetum coccineum]